MTVEILADDWEAADPPGWLHDDPLHALVETNGNLVFLTISEYNAVYKLTLKPQQARALAALLLETVDGQPVDD